MKRLIDTKIMAIALDEMLHDVYFYLLDSLKSNAKPSGEMKRIVSDIPSRIDYWLIQIK